MVLSVLKRNKDTITELRGNPEIVSEPIVLFPSWICVSLWI